jgi:hypothetical protein
LHGRPASAGRFVKGRRSPGGGNGEQLGATGSNWEQLGATGSNWEQLGATANWIPAFAGMSTLFFRFPLSAFRFPLSAFRFRFPLSAFRFPLPLRP